MDGKTFAKLCKDCGLIDKSLTLTDVDIIFAKVVPQKQRRIDLDLFIFALSLLAEKKGVAVDHLVRQLRKSEGPVLTATKADSVPFHDDKSLYTGVHRQGGPDVSGQSWRTMLRGGDNEDEAVPAIALQRLVREGRRPVKEDKTAPLPARAKRDALKTKAPMDSDEITMVFTDVQGSTSLWEANSAAMETALRLHDQTMRQSMAKFDGYEVTTEGDAFQIFFHDAFDAVSFCLDVQTSLLSCPWSQEILALPDAAPTADRAWRGLRVRMGMHSGRPASVTRHEVTGRWRYAGSMVALAKAVEGACNGGQILLSAECFFLVSGLLTQLGSPQVVDIGEYSLRGPGLADGAESAAVRLVQLVPAAISYDYFGCVPGSPADAPPIGGRLFEPAPAKQISPGFAESPCGASITLCFLFTKGGKDLMASDIALGAASLGMVREAVRKRLQIANGYECQEDEGDFMLAFSHIGDAVRFGYEVQSVVLRLPWPAELRARGPEFARGLRVAVGALSGAYTSRGPHASTGRADYFGTIVNRTARIAAAAAGGQTLIGGDVSFSGFPAGVNFTRLGQFSLKGVEEPMVLNQLLVPLNEKGALEAFPEPKTKGRLGD